MGVLIRAPTDDDAWEVRGVIRDGVFRGGTDIAEIAATYGYDDEDAVSRGLNNHYINATVMPEDAVTKHWDDGWEVEYTMEDVSGADRD